MKYNYYNHKSFVKTCLKVTCYLLFVLFAYSCYQSNKEYNRAPLYHLHTLDTPPHQVSSTPSYYNNHRVIAVSLVMAICWAVGWYLLFASLRKMKWVQTFPERTSKAEKSTNKTLDTEEYKGQIDQKHKKMIKKLASRIVSSLHATLIFISAFFYIVIKKIDIKDWRRYLSLSMGYFLADAFITYQNFNGKEDAFMLLHHLIAMVAICTAFMNQKGYKPYLKETSPAKLVAQGFLCEFTMPLVYLCWYLNEIGVRGIWLIIPSAGALCAYAYLRIANFTYIGYILYQNRAKVIWPFILSMPLILLNYYWFITLCIIAFKKLGENLAKR